MSSVWIMMWNPGSISKYTLKGKHRYNNTLGIKEHIKFNIGAPLTSIIGSTRFNLWEYFVSNSISISIVNIVNKGMLKFSMNNCHIIWEWLKSSSTVRLCRSVDRQEKHFNDFLSKFSTAGNTLWWKYSFWWARIEIFC